MSTKPIAIPRVNGSPRTAIPSASATAGFKYVMTVARVDPTSRMSAKNTTNPIAVHTTPSAATALMTEGDGRLGGSCAMPIGAYTTAVMASDATTTPSEGSVDSLREMMAGPVA